MGFVYGLLDFFRFLCYQFGVLIMVRSVMSWFSPRPSSTLAIYLYRVTEPLLMPLRRVIPRTGVVDLSPLAAVVLLYIIGNLS